MNNEKKFWFDKKHNVNKIILGVVTSCILLLIVDFFYEKHSQVFVENWFGFYSLYGFIICCGIVFGGKLMRKLLTKKDNFYDD